MYVYLASVDVEVELPQAVDATRTDDVVSFIDANGAIIAIFPAASVAMYSTTRSYNGHTLNGDGVSKASSPTHTSAI